MNNFIMKIQSDMTWKWVFWRKWSRNPLIGRAWKSVVQWRNTLMEWSCFSHPHSAFTTNLACYDVADIMACSTLFHALVHLPEQADHLQMVQPQGWAPSHDIGKAGSDSENAGLSVVMENPFNVPFWLNMCGDTDLSRAGCGSSARPLLRRGPTG